MKPIHLFAIALFCLIGLPAALFIKAAGNRKYQEVIDAMDIARGSGIEVIGFTPKAG